MKKLLDFKTTLGEEEIIKVLKKNTFPTEMDFQTLLFDTYYFSGQVNNQRIRIKNAVRTPKSPSPILDITMSNKDGVIEVVIHDDTADDVIVNSMMILTITGSLSVVILLVGGILSFVQPDSYSILWTIIISLLISGLGLGNSYFYKETLKLNTKGDLNYLVKLLTQ